MNDTNLNKTLGRQEKRKIRQRKQRYQKALEEQGFEVHVAAGTNDQFMAVLVIDPAADRKGFLGPEGNIQWMDELQQANIGALSRFVVSSLQGPADEKLRPS